MSPVRSVTYVSGTDTAMMVARDGVEPPTPAFSALDTASLSPFLVNYLTCRGGHSFVTTL